MSTEYYIYSCGSGPVCDTCWVRTTPEGQERSDPAILAGLKIREFGGDTVHSIGLERSGDRLVLLVTGLVPTEGNDIQQKRHSSLACAGASADEAVLRGIAAAALRGSLNNLVDQAILPDPDTNGTGFRVARSLVEQLSGLRAPDSLPLLIADAFIGRNSGTLRVNLARVLDTHVLPATEGPLVVVTEGVEPGVLERAGVWRSLTDRYAMDDDTSPSVWQPLPGRRLDLSRRDLRGVDLKHISLRGADLTYADMTAKDLEGTDLREADLRYANLSEATLRRANLSGADLRHANLYGADLRSADMAGANLWWARLNGAVYNPETRWSFIHRMLSGAVQKYR